jgi:hypothetical protein
VLRVCTLRISCRAAASGGGTSSSRSNLPGRNKAGSTLSGLLVAASTTTPRRGCRIPSSQQQQQAWKELNAVRDLHSGAGSGSYSAGSTLPRKFVPAATSKAPQQVHSNGSSAREDRRLIARTSWPHWQCGADIHSCSRSAATTETLRP